MRHDARLVKDQTVLGFDFGLKHIGVAVGQTVTCTATPLPSLKAKNGEPNWDKITELLKRWRPDELIVGAPFTEKGKEQRITQAARRFAAQLQARYPLPVAMIDERYTSIEARSLLFEKGGYRALDKDSIDSLAAKIITESAMNQRDTT